MSNRVAGKGPPINNPLYRGMPKELNPVSWLKKIKQIRAVADRMREAREGQIEINLLWELVALLKKPPKKERIAGFKKKEVIAEIKEVVSLRFTQRASELFDAGEYYYNEIITLLKGVLSFDENNKDARDLLDKTIEALLDKAKEYKEENRPGDALRCCEKIAEAGPAQLDSWFRMGVLYKELRRYKKAIGSYKKALKLNENNIDILMGLGEVYEKKGSFNNALSFYSRVEKIDPRSVPAKQGMFRAYVRLKRDKKAIIEKAEEIKNLDPKNKNILHELGRLYPKIGQLDKACSVYEEILKLDPEDSDARKKLDIIKEEISKSEKTVPPKEETPKKEPQPRPLTPEERRRKEEKEIREKKEKVFKWFQSRLDKGLGLRGGGFSKSIPRDLQNIIRNQRIFGNVSTALREFCEKPQKTKSSKK